MPHKCHVNIIIINTQGQIVQIYFIKKGCLTRNYVAGRKFHLQPAKSRVLGKAVCHFPWLRVVIVSVSKVKGWFVALFGYCTRWGLQQNFADVSSDLPTFPAGSWPLKAQSPPPSPLEHWVKSYKKCYISILIHIQRFKKQHWIFSFSVING